MTRDEWITRLMERIAELDMAALTATEKELGVLEELRRDLCAQLEDMRTSHPRLKAA